MGKSDAKGQKKAAKAQAKTEKAKADAAARIAEAQAAAPTAGLPAGVGVSIRKRNGGADLVVSGLKDEQLERLVPQINKEILIAVAADKSAFNAGLKTFLRDGVVPALVKVIAGLIVGFLLVKFGLG